MKALLDTNIIIHREANRIVEKEIGLLFNWIDKLHYEKYIHPITVSEIENYQNKQVVGTFAIKLDSYNLIKHQLPVSATVERVSFCLLYTSPSPRDLSTSRMPSSA